MIKAHYQTLFAYSWHTTQRLLESAAKLTPDDLRASPGYGHGSLHDLFFHVMATQQAWRVGLETGQQPPRMAAEGFESLDALRRGLADETSAFEQWLAGQSDAQIAAPITLRDVRGNAHPMITWRVLQHLVLHAMQHHTEIAHLLTVKGQSPGDIDFLFYRG